MMRGAGPTAVMQLLADQEMYGYQIVAALSLRTHGVFKLGQSTLYPMLYNLEAKGLVSSRHREGPNGRIRRYYRLTVQGRKKLEVDRKQWSALIQGMEALGISRVAHGDESLGLAGGIA
jgi:PadR family transcriptional regulator PadR